MFQEPFTLDQIAVNVVGKALEKQEPGLYEDLWDCMLIVTKGK